MLVCFLWPGAECNCPTNYDPPRSCSAWGEACHLRRCKFFLCMWYFGLNFGHPRVTTMRALIDKSLFAWFPKHNIETTSRSCLVRVFATLKTPVARSDSLCIPLCTTHDQTWSILVLMCPHGNTCITPQRRLYFFASWIWPIHCENAAPNREV